MSHARSFPPLAESSATTLILGSMPGMASLAAQQYYAHPRNAFWPIMGELVGAHTHLRYDQRVSALLAARIAVWDVLETCIRPGSLDGSILKQGLVANDFSSFFAHHGNVSRVFFNGAKAAQLFETLVTPSLGEMRLHRQTLPSTSPANASLRYADKLAAWRAIAYELPANVAS
jgi:TDG/mug DNA glycosylase family protein